MTKGTERLHAFAVGVLSTVVGFTVVFAAPETQPFWSQAASLILTIPAAFAGGEIRRATMGRGRRPT
jgi:putative flippase GtrA